MRDIGQIDPHSEFLGAKGRSARVATWYYDVCDSIRFSQRNPSCLALSQRISARELLMDVGKHVGAAIIAIKCFRLCHEHIYARVSMYSRDGHVRLSAWTNFRKLGFYAPRVTRLPNKFRRRTCSRDFLSVRARVPLVGTFVDEYSSTAIIRFIVPFILLVIPYGDRSNLFQIQPCAISLENTSVAIAGVVTSRACWKFCKSL